jgi:hypothetical protein
MNLKRLTDTIENQRPPFIIINLSPKEEGDYMELLMDY